MVVALAKSLDFAGGAFEVTDWESLVSGGAAMAVVDGGMEKSTTRADMFSEENKYSYIQRIYHEIVFPRAFTNRSDGLFGVFERDGRRLYGGGIIYLLASPVGECVKALRKCVKSESCNVTSDAPSLL